MRTSLSENRETAPGAGLKARCPATKLALLQQKRSGCHLGAAEAVDQTFLRAVF
jgi:hypothetical protein